MKVRRAQVTSAPSRPVAVAPLDLEMVPTATLVLDSLGHVVHANRRASVLLGREPQLLRGMSSVELLGRDLLGAWTGAPPVTKLPIVLPSGRTITVLLSFGPFGESGADPHTIVTLMPVAADSHEDHSALPVTGFKDVAQRVAALEGDGLCVAIGVVGLQSVNDSFSRNSGDIALAEIDRRIHLVRLPGAVIARTGGNRFMVVSHSHADPSATIAALTAAVRKPITTSLGNITLGCALGVTEGALRPSRVLLDRADRNLEVALRRGAGSVEWRDSLPPAVREPVGRLGAPLLELLARDGVSAEFQAVVELATGRIVEYEAFARWDEQATGRHSASQVIRVATDIGAIDELGVSVLRRSLELCTRLQSTGRDSTRVSVNVSTSELALQEFATRTLSMLNTAGVPGTMLQIELTDHASATDVDLVRPNVKALRLHGVRFALDGFGHNASNMFTLRDLDIDCIKLDPALTTGVREDSRSAMVLSATLELARRIGADVVAKGVETREQHRLLQRIGCGYGQGFLYQHPQTEAEVCEAVDFSLPPPEPEVDGHDQDLWPSLGGAEVSMPGQ